MLAAGLKGIEEKLEPPMTIEKNIYSLSEEEKRQYGIEHLPDSLGHSLSLMSKSKLVQDVLGEHVFNNFLYVKRNEWREYSTQVTKWETDKYLSIL
jgi:glutamine synthetase